MRRNSVIIKSNAYGLTIKLDPQLPFDELRADVEEKFRDAERFFKGAQMAVTFQERVLTSEEENALIDAITTNARMQIVCIVDEDKANAEQAKEAIIRALASREEGKAKVHLGTVTNGQSVESDQDLVILGDVNPGASVTARGNLMILGCCMGNASAGLGGDQDAFVAALTLKPQMLRIADKAARAAITKKTDTGEYPIEPKIARIVDGHLAMDKLKGSSFQELVMRRKEGVTEDVSTI